MVSPVTPAVNGVKPRMFAPTHTGAVDDGR